jgi:acetyltransferase-like isoleucine patch superfamily enzyme
MEEMFYERNDYYRPQSEFLPLRNSRGLMGKILSPESYSLCLRMRHRLRDNVGKKVFISASTSIAEGSYVDDNTIIGEGCVIHRDVYVGKNVKIGNGVELLDNNYIFEGITIDDGAFIGPNVSFINTRYPRSSMIIRYEKPANNYKLEKTHICYGASIGAGSVVMCGVTIGKHAMVAAGSVVLEDVPDGAMVAGNPARIIKENVVY